MATPVGDGAGDGAAAATNMLGQQLLDSCPLGRWTTLLVDSISAQQHLYRLHLLPNTTHLQANGMDT